MMFEWVNVILTAGVKKGACLDIKVQRRETPKWTQQTVILRVAGFMKNGTGFIAEAEKMSWEPPKASEQKKTHKQKTHKSHLEVTMVWRLDLQVRVEAISQLLYRIPGFA